MRWIIPIFCFLTLQVHAEVYQLEKKNGIQLVGKDLNYFEDPSASLSIDDILQSEVQGKFLKSEQDIILFNISSSTFWIKITVTTQEKEKWCISWGMPSAQYINFYRVQKGKISTTISGIKIPSDEREMIGHNVIFNMDIHPGDTADIYISVNDVAPMRALIKIGTIEQFFGDDYVINFWQGAYYGVMILMALYNLFFIPDQPFQSLFLLYNLCNHQCGIHCLLYGLHEFFSRLVFTHLYLCSCDLSCHIRGFWHFIYDGISQYPA